MSRYIDADKLIADLEKWKRNPNNDDSSMDLVNHFQGIIQAEPTADVIPREFHDKTCEAMAKRHQNEIADMVSVVWCKVCVKRMRGDCPMCNGCKLDRVPTEDDDYCSYGERKA